MPPSVIHRTVFTCRHVLEGAPILRVSRHRRDGVWRYLCGCRSHTGEELRLVSRRVMVDRDATLATLDAMPAGGRARRDAGEPHWRADRPPC